MLARFNVDRGGSSLTTARFALAESYSGMAGGGAEIDSDTVTTADGGSRPTPCKAKAIVDRRPSLANNAREWLRIAMQQIALAQDEPDAG